MTPRQSGADSVEHRDEAQIAHKVLEGPRTILRPRSVLYLLSLLAYQISALWLRLGLEVRLGLGDAHGHKPCAGRVYSASVEHESDDDEMKTDGKPQHC